MRASKGLLICCVLFLFASLSAGTISGFITQEKSGKGIRSCSVYLSNAGNGTVTDQDGFYLLSTPDKGSDTLVVKIIGYKTKKVELIFPVKEMISLQLETHVIPIKGKVTVTATRRLVSVNNTTVSLSVIDREEIEGSSAQNIAEILENTPSLQVRDYGGAGNMKTVSLRGTSAGHVLIMVDGQRINNPQNGEVDFALIPIDHVEKIEVIRGGSSALYGSDAIGGVIHIITKENDKNKKFGLGVKQGFASFGTYSLESNITTSFKRTGLIAAYHYLSSESNFSYEDTFGEEQIRVNNDIKRHAFFTGINYRTSDEANAFKLKMNYYYLTSERGAPGTISFPYPHARMFDEQHDLGLVLSKKSKNLKHQFEVRTYYSNDFNRYLNQHPSEVFFPSDDNYLTEAVGTEMQITSIFIPQFVLNYGVSIRNDMFENLGIEERHERLSYAAYLVEESMFTFPSTIIPKIRITPSLRYNGNNEFKDTWTPKIGFLVNLGPSNKFALKSNYAYNYRVPTFNDLYWPADAYTSGNPDLLPEYGKDWDLGLRFHNEFIDMEVTYFNENLSNLIIWQAEDWVWTPQNVAESRINGLENNIKIIVLNQAIQLTANYSYMNALDLTDGIENATILPNRAKHNANLGLLISQKNFDLKYSLQYVGKRYSDSSNTEDLALASYLVNNISLAYTLKSDIFKVQGIFEIKNLFNTRYSILKDLPLPGREVRLTLNTELHKMK
ncbi:MAG: TonB-dependent receptor [Candidatus Marinimicrobia bacterium]|nr:TonB-dependent receptor [Candidatus Neomarinimicrobiota bacterium]